MKYLFLLFVTFALSAYTLPAGWSKAGSKPADYDMGTDVGAGRTNPNATTIKSISATINGFGMLSQNMSPATYLGKRLKMTAYMKAANVKDWAGMWLRVDGKPGEQLSFDNMHNRPIKGTQGWTKCEVVLDVPKEATNIAFGALMYSTGQVWFDDVTFEEVTYNVATTDYTNNR